MLQLIKILLMKQDFTQSNSFSIYDKPDESFIRRLKQSMRLSHSDAHVSPIVLKQIVQFAATIDIKRTDNIGLIENFAN